MEKQGLDYKKTFLLGFGFLGVSVLWTIYNAYVPIFLQAGNPEFEGAAKSLGFGLSAGLAGFIMTLAACRRERFPPNLIHGKIAAI